MSALLDVRGLAVNYGEAQVLHDVAFEVGPGEAVAVLGANGAGKSSLAAAITGVVEPSAGTVVLDGVDVTGWPAHRVSREGLIYAPEGRGIFPNLSVNDNLRALLRWSVPAADRSAALDRAFEAFPVLAERRRQHAGTLSGGEQQMLNLARMLAVDPKIVVADEMSLGLAPLMVDIVFDGLERARSAGVAVLVIEQYVDRALGFVDRAVVLGNGTVAWQGPASDAREQALSGYLGGGEDTGG